MYERRDLECDLLSRPEFEVEEGVKRPEPEDGIESLDRDVH